MIATAGVLALLALALAGPVPILLARAGWTRRSPASALLLWQSVAVAGGLSMIGAPLALGLAPFGTDFGSASRGAVAALAREGVGALSAWSWAGIVTAGALAAYLLAHLALTVVQVQRHRRRHLALLELLSGPAPQAGARLLEDAAPVAYCLPRARRPLTVVSRGLLELLDERELDAEIAHERAHAEQRHDVLLVAFRAWRSALPGFPSAALAERQVAQLVEMLADDRARRATDERVLARAIVLAAPHPGARLAGPVTGTLAGSAADGARVGRLLDGTLPLPIPMRFGAVALAVALVGVPTLWLLLDAVLL
ncbi:M56 family metallopeptidase [Lysinimonas soli]|uniref:M56 family metallopeptidase n=1 Tax=Lysinimonas soli TaxID=1074233 RepID=A0ABW0NQA3_9MICO